MASVASQLIEEVTVRSQSDSLEDAREICADGTYFPNNLRTAMMFNILYSYTFQCACDPECKTGIYTFKHRPVITKTCITVNVKHLRNIIFNLILKTVITIL